MKLGIQSIDLFREATARLGPTGSTARQQCTTCKRRKSVGQFAKGTTECITCKPQGKNFRRGDL